MKRSLNLLIIFSSIIPLVLSNQDRSCDHDLSNLWLDVVVVVDNSAGMGDDGLIQIAAQLGTIFGQGTRIGSNYSDPRSTRVALITYNSHFNIIADLNQYKSADEMIDNIFDALDSPSQSLEAYLNKGLGAAETVLTNGRANNFRSNYKQVVIIYASDYIDDGENDPIPIANRLKGSGVQIITVAFDQDGDETLIRKIGELATPGFNFTNLDTDLVKEIENSLIQANCFCPPTWNQYKNDFFNKYSHKYGVCLTASSLQAGWKPAMIACQTIIRNGYLVTEYTKHKHDYVLQLISNNPAISKPYNYHIGLNWINSIWKWQQPSGHILVPKTNDNNSWASNFPSQPNQNPAVYNQQNGTLLKTFWKNCDYFKDWFNYVCEVKSCDTSNYCDNY